MDILSDIQTRLKAPKNQFNKFGGYNYRNCEDILNALKPLLKEHDAHILLEDDIVCVEGWHYVKAHAVLVKNGSCLGSSKAFARESETKKGMDSSQITGSTSSYARKYALNGLFAIDDTKDADSDEKQNNETDRQSSKTKASPPEPEPATNKTKKAGKFGFLETVKKLKKELADDELYYQILRVYGYEKSNEITDRKSQEAFYQDLKIEVDKKKGEANA